jgi:hypothetical protein
MTQESVALNEISQVTNQELITRLQLLVRADQKLNARLLMHLGEVDARGFYCVEQLQMSEAQAYLRIQAARLSRQFSLVLQCLAQGSLHLSAIKLLGPHLTADNHVQLLERARCKGKREIELLVAAIAPKPDVPSRMRKLPETSSARPEARVAPTPVEAPLAQTLIAHEAREPKAAQFVLEPPVHRASARPLSSGRYKLEFTAGQALHDYRSEP